MFQGRNEKIFKLDSENVWQLKYLLFYANELYRLVLLELVLQQKKKIGYFKHY